MNTAIKKDPYLGWMGVTWIEIGKTEEGKARIIEFTTAKRHGGKVHTMAQVYELCLVTRSKSFMVFQDYSQPVKSFEVTRSIQSRIEACHLAAAAEFPAHVEKAKAQYATA